MFDFCFQGGFYGNEDWILFDIKVLNIKRGVSFCRCKFFQLLDMLWQEIFELLYLYFLGYFLKWCELNN